MLHLDDRRTPAAGCSGGCRLLLNMFRSLLLALASSEHCLAVFHFLSCRFSQFSCTFFEVQALYIIASRLASSSASLGCAITWSLQNW